VVDGDGLGEGGGEKEEGFEEGEEEFIAKPLF
jgi:hypothetical protein